MPTKEPKLLSKDAQKIQKELEAPVEEQKEEASDEPVLAAPSGVVLPDGTVRVDH